MTWLATKNFLSEWGVIVALLVFIGLALAARLLP
jgi:cbb3-type cytochrome oxidase subunit 3